MIFPRVADSTLLLCALAREPTSAGIGNIALWHMGSGS